MLRVDGPRLLARLAELARVGASPSGGLQRLAFSAADLEARRVVAARMVEAGLRVRADAVANTIGFFPVRGPALVLGSHTDTVPDGGRFDGALGVVAGLESARCLAEAGLAAPLEVVNFQSEECGLLGSRAWLGELEPESLADPRTHAAIRELGGAPDQLPQARRAHAELRAYLELHIEQGPRLEEAGVAIGVVDAIFGIRRFQVTLIGSASHAGATPMARRRDALVAAARLTLAVQGAAATSPGEQVATVGRFAVEPNAVNVIPGRVGMSIDLRACDLPTLEAMERRIRSEAAVIVRETGVEISLVQESSVAPAHADESVMAAIVEAADELGLRHQSLTSHALHDASNLAQLAPMGMIFVPSVGGISHHPAELTHDHDCLNGANVLLNAARILLETKHH